MRNKIAELRNLSEPPLSQEDLAKLAGISRPHLSEIETGKADPGGQVMLRIADSLKKKVEDVFFIDSVV